MLLLDEPTNHLDIDAREALVQALNAYEGAVVIVSHDPTMVERVADRLWLIKDGKCSNFDGDLKITGILLFNPAARNGLPRKKPPPKPKKKQSLLKMYRPKICRN